MQKIARKLGLTEMFGGMTRDDDQDLAPGYHSAPWMGIRCFEPIRRQLCQRVRQSRTQILPARADKGGCVPVGRELARAVAPYRPTAEYFQNVLFGVAERVRR